MISAAHTVEESLRQAEDRCAMLLFFSDGMQRIDSVPDPAVFSGIADTCEEIETIVSGRRARA